MATATRAGSVGAAFSSSSLSLPASVDTFSAVVQLRAPQFAARSPSLRKASQGVAEAAAIRGAVPPCVFTLRGKQQTREHAAQHEGGGCRAATTASSSPRRPPLYRVIDIGQGYSPRLRVLSGEEFLQGSKTTKVATEPLSATSRPTAASPTGAAKDTPCGVAAAIECSAMVPRQGTPYPCQQDISTPSERDLVVDSAAEPNELIANPARGSRARTTGAPSARERPMTTSRTDCLCGGRLWTGTTSPQPEMGRPRVLFLVSGQQQQLKDHARTPCGERRRQQHSVRGDVRPPRTRARNSTTAVPRGRREPTASSGRRWERGSCDDARAGREGENKGREGETRSGREADKECDDAPTTAATDGRGDDSTRRVLHVRVPQAPPTPLLVIRSAPPTTS